MNTKISEHPETDALANELHNASLPTVACYHEMRKWANLLEQQCNTLLVNSHLTPSESQHNAQALASLPGETFENTENKQNEKRH
jgi:hypothetical protein